jgi:N-glycosylase/DNA lyase
VTGQPLSPIVSVRAGRETVSFRWGFRHELGSAAYWVDQASRTPEPLTFALGDNLVEEVAACILGGFGLPAAVGLAAFQTVRASVDLHASPRAEDLITYCGGR